jgi:hypothetical protein
VAAAGRGGGGGGPPPAESFRNQESYPTPSFEFLKNSLLSVTYIAGEHGTVTIFLKHNNFTRIHSAS